jgi:hypothetical protein
MGGSSGVKDSSITRSELRQKGIIQSLRGQLWKIGEEDDE